MLPKHGSNNKRSHRPSLTERASRTVCYFGLHFDFHASPEKLPLGSVGSRTTRAMIARIIRAVRPDFIQCDCKGHPGWSSYPTKTGNPMPRITDDPLKTWRDVTARHGVRLYVHYSGVWDTRAMKMRPEWAAVERDGKASKDYVSVFGPYGDEFLIPQLRELAGEYKLDGVWIDGDCWAAQADYCRAVANLFRKATGRRVLPRDPADPDFHTFLEICREGFRKYVAHYVDTLHREYPRFEICSNWLYSHFMPEKPVIPVDFLSGDLACEDAVRDARWTARVFAAQGKPWDLMAWGFRGKWGQPGRSEKTSLQLKQEAAHVLSHGGGFQIYFKQRMDGSISESVLPIAADVAAFCRARQGHCRRAVTVPQVALLFPVESHYRALREPFQCWNGEQNPVRGTLQALLDGQLSVDVLMEHQLGARASEYPLIVLSEWKFLSRALRRRLLSYARGGGRLLVVGCNPCREFAPHLGLRVENESVEREVHLMQGRHIFKPFTQALSCAAQRGTTVLAWQLDRDDETTRTMPAAVVRDIGRGRIAGIPFDFGIRYYEGTTNMARDWFHVVVRKLFPRPIVEVKGSHLVDVVVNRSQGQLAIHLINSGGPHSQAHQYVWDEIPALGPLDVAVRLSRAPRSITMMPDHSPVAFEWSKRTAILRIDRLAIHQTLLVRE